MNVLNKYKMEKGTPGVYIGRPSPLGNPFKVDTDGSREEVVALYREWLIGKLLQRDPEVELAFRALKPTDNLICYCDPAPCHGHVLKSVYETIWEELDYDAGLKHLARRHGLDSDPLKDGVTHINVYSKASTLLGRALSNFAHFPFELPDHGKFESVEGYWYWLSTGCRHDRLRSLSGYDAKKYGKKFEKVPIEDFEKKICAAIRCKLDTHPKLKKLFKESTLPFKHYYYYGEPNNPKVVNGDGTWIMNFLHELRSILQGGEDVKRVKGRVQTRGLTCVTFSTSGTVLSNTLSPTMPTGRAKVTTTDLYSTKISRSLQTP